MRLLWQSFTKPGTRYLEVLRQTVQRLAPPDVTVDVAGLEPTDRYVHRISELRCGFQVLAQNLHVADRGYDGLVIGHFQDGGLHELRSALDIPVVGLGECALHTAAQLGDSFGLVTIHPDHRAFHRRQVRLHQLESRFVDVLAMTTTPDTYFAAFDGHAQEIDHVAQEFRTHAQRLADAGADIVIPAGGFPALLLWAYNLIPDLGGAAVLDPIGLAVGQAATWVRLGRQRVAPGRSGSFKRPEPGVLQEVSAAITRATADGHPSVENQHWIVEGK